MSIKRSSVLYLLLVALLATACGSPAVTEAPSTATPISAPTSASIVPTAPALANDPTEPAAADSAADTAMQYVERVDTPLARVNGQEITWEDYEPGLRQALSAVSRQGNVNWNDAAMQLRLGQLQNDVLSQTVDRWLLRKIAADQGIVISQENVQAKLQEERDKVEAGALYESWESYLVANGFTDRTIEQLAHDRLMLTELLEAQQVDLLEEQVHIAHISLEDRAKAQEVMDKLKAGEDFAKLAAEYSMDEETRDSGGDLGWFSPALMLPELGQAATGLQPGQFSEVIATRYGFTIITLLERDMREADPSVLAQRKQAGLAAVLTAERDRAEIEILVNFDQVEEEPE